MKLRAALTKWMIALGALVVAGCSATSPGPTPTAAALPTATSLHSAMLACTSIETSPTPDTSSLIPPVDASDYSTGPETAPVTLLAYCDLQSAECELFNRVLDQLRLDHPDQLRVVYRLFPVPVEEVASLDKSESSAMAAIAAGNQEAFWEMRALLHRRYSDWASLSPPDFREWVLDEAQGLDLDAGRFAADLESAETRARSNGSFAEATGLGITSIPTVFINGRLQARAALSYSGLGATIGLVALGARQFSECPPFRLDATREYLATLKTEKGEILIRLLPERAPLAVNSFVFLAQAGWFDGTTFHRVVPGFVAMAGDPSGTGQGGPGYYFSNEVFADLKFNRPGVVGMNNAGPDVNGSQFFITYQPRPELDGLYTIFGQVVEGMLVLESLTPRDPLVSAGLPVGDKILSITIEIR